MTPADWNILDWTLAMIALLSVLRGIWKGGISQIFGIGGVLGGFLLATHFYEGLSKQIEQSFPKFSGSPMFSFAVLFFLTWFCLGCLGFWLGRLLRSKGLGLLDRTLGAAIGLGKAVILATILLSFLTLFFPPQSLILKHSELAPYVQEMTLFLIKITPENLQKRFAKKQEEFKRYWSRQVDKTSEKQEKQSGKGTKKPNDKQPKRSLE